VIIAAGVEMTSKYKGLVFDERLGGNTKKCYPLYCEYCDEEFMVKAKSSPKRRKHSCGNWATQRYTGVAWTQKSDDQIRRKVQKFNHEGYNKDQANQFYESSIEGSKKRIEGVGGAAHYKAVLPDLDFMTKNGLAVKMSDEQAQITKKAREQVVEKHIGNNKNFNRNRSNSNQTIK
jgi:hypothetical protein